MKLYVKTFDMSTFDFVQRWLNENKIKVMAISHPIEHISVVEVDVDDKSIKRLNMLLLKNLLVQIDTNSTIVWSANSKDANIL